MTPVVFSFPCLLRYEQPWLLIVGSQLQSRRHRSPGPACRPNLTTLMKYLHSSILDDAHLQDWRSHGASCYLWRLCNPGNDGVLHLGRMICCYSLAASLPCSIVPGDVGQGAVPLYKVVTTCRAVPWATGNGQWPKTSGSSFQPQRQLAPGNRR